MEKMQQLIRGGRREVRELLSDDAHLFPICLVGGDEAHLVTDRRADASPRRRFPQRGAHGLGIGQAACPDDLERSFRPWCLALFLKTYDTPPPAPADPKGRCSRALRARNGSSPQHAAMTSPRHVSPIAGSVAG